MDQIQDDVAIGNGDIHDEMIFDDDEISHESFCAVDYNYEVKYQNVMYQVETGNPRIMSLDLRFDFIEGCENEDWTDLGWANSRHSYLKKMSVTR
jgi:hypothetical protein